MMQRFALSIEYAAQREDLLASLHGSGAFRRFKDTVHRLGLAEAWYAYRDKGYEDVARAWCAENNIAIDTDADA